MIKLRELYDLIKRKVRKNSISIIAYNEGFLQDTITLISDYNKITITKDLFDFLISYKQDDETVTEVAINANSSDFLHEIMIFINSHVTTQDSEEESEEN